MKQVPDYIQIKRIYIRSASAGVFNRLAELTEDGGSMIDWLNGARNGSKNYISYMAIDTRVNKIVGWVCVTTISDWHLYNGEKKIGTFIDYSYRRQGIGSALVKQVQTKEKSFIYWKGAYDARSFYGSNVPNSKNYNGLWNQVNPQ